MGSVEPEIYTKMLRNLSEKHAAKFPFTLLRYSMVSIACLSDAQSRRKRKGEKKIKKNEKPKDVGHFFKIFDF